MLYVPENLFLFSTERFVEAAQNETFSAERDFRPGKNNMDLDSGRKP
ncbi:MAG: hypothetical protein ACPK85_15400 [Methanosarcina sp.]